VLSARLFLVADELDYEFEREVWVLGREVVVERVALGCSHVEAGDLEQLHQPLFVEAAKVVRAVGVLVEHEQHVAKIGWLGAAVDALEQVVLPLVCARQLGSGRPFLFVEHSDDEVVVDVQRLLVWLRLLGLRVLLRRC